MTQEQKKPLTLEDQKANVDSQIRELIEENLSRRTPDGWLQLIPIPDGVRHNLNLGPYACCIADFEAKTLAYYDSAFDLADSMKVHVRVTLGSRGYPSPETDEEVNNVQL